MRKIDTQFDGNVRSYLRQFDQDVTSYLSTMPSLDTNVVLGLLPSPLNPSASHEIVSDSMRLDPSAKNGMPPSACVWLGARIVPLGEAIEGVVTEETTNDGNWLVGVRAKRSQDLALLSPTARQKLRLLELRMQSELDLLTRYPVLCETRAQDEHYGAAGGRPMNPENTWEDAFDRRLGRIDKLTVAWRDSMMCEWASRYANDPLIFYIYITCFPYYILLSRILLSRAAHFSQDMFGAA